MPANRYDVGDLYFNLGCDARYAGRPLGVNPGTDTEERKSWHDGWLHMNNCWGIERKQWTTPLVPVEA